MFLKYLIAQLNQNKSKTQFTKETAPLLTIRMRGWKKVEGLVKYLVVVKCSKLRNYTLYKHPEVI